MKIKMRIQLYLCIMCCNVFRTNAFADKYDLGNSQENPTPATHPDDADRHSRSIHKYPTKNIVADSDDVDEKFGTIHKYPAKNPVEQSNNVDQQFRPINKYPVGGPNQQSNDADYFRPINKYPVGGPYQQFNNADESFGSNYNNPSEYSTENYFVQPTQAPPPKFPQSINQFPFNINFGQTPGFNDLNQNINGNYHTVIKQFFSVNDYSTERSMEFSDNIGNGFIQDNQQMQIPQNMMNFAQSFNDRWNNLLQNLPGMTPNGNSNVNINDDFFKGIDSSITNMFPMFG